MDNKKNGTRAYYKAACAVIFLLFCFIYVYFYQTDVLAAAQHIASGGQTQYEPILGTVLIIIALKALQNGIQAVVRLKWIFFALSYLPSFLILAMITDLPSGVDREINFGAWVWVLPVVLLLWAAIVYIAKQYQSIELDFRNTGLFSQVNGINLTLMLAMMLMVCLIGNHNRHFHYQMHVENLISRQEYRQASKSVETYKSDDYRLSMLRVYSLAQSRLIGDSLFEMPLSGVHTIIPSIREPFTVIVSTKKMTEVYKRSADWQLSELLVRKNLPKFYSQLVGVYNLGQAPQTADSTNTNSANKKTQAKLNAYKDSLLSVKYHNLPRHYREALVLYNARQNSSASYKIKGNYLDSLLVRRYDEFVNTPVNERKSRFAGTYWLFYSN